MTQLHREVTTYKKEMVLYVEETERKDELVDKYFKSIEKYFLRALKCFKDGQGFGGKMNCCFASECEPEDDEYFGDSGVGLFFEVPIVDKDTIVILDYITFYIKLKSQQAAMV